MGRTYHIRMCQFECRLTYAINQTGCMPWDYPNPSSDQIMQERPICTSGNNTESNQLQRFEKAMKSPKSLDNCNCMPNCEEVNFELQVKQYISSMKYSNNTFQVQHDCT